MKKQEAIISICFLLSLVSGGEFCLAALGCKASTIVLI